MAQFKSKKGTKRIIRAAPASRASTNSAQLPSKPLLIKEQAAHSDAYNVNQMSMSAANHKQESWEDTALRIIEKYADAWKSLADK